jgi:hypothetical protein
MSAAAPGAYGAAEGCPSVRITVQGKPVARRGRKAMGSSSEDRPAAGPGSTRTDSEGVTVNANLARFTRAVAPLDAAAPTVGGPEAGHRWS